MVISQVATEYWHHYFVLPTDDTHTHTHARSQDKISLSNPIFLARHRQVEIKRILSR